MSTDITLSIGLAGHAAGDTITLDQASATALVQGGFAVEATKKPSAKAKADAAAEVDTTA